jgi:hypothetical protein
VGIEIFNTKNTIFLAKIRTSHLDFVPKMCQVAGVLSAVESGTTERDGERGSSSSVWLSPTTSRAWWGDPCSNFQAKKELDGIER